MAVAAGTQLKRLESRFQQSNQISCTSYSLLHTQRNGVDICVQSSLSPVTSGSHPESTACDQIYEKNNEKNFKKQY